MREREAEGLIDHQRQCDAGPVLKVERRTVMKTKRVGVTVEGGHLGPLHHATLVITIMEIGDMWGHACVMKEGRHVCDM
jgi:hypothetical protein